MRICMGLLLVAAIAALWTAKAQAAPDFGKPVNLSVKGYQLYANGEPMRGIFYMWHAGKVDSEHGESYYRSEFRRMKELGAIGVGIEIGWNTIEPQDGKFNMAADGQDQFIRWAQDEGLWVHLLFTPHYSPSWLFSKYGDIKMKTIEGKDSDGSFLTFSPHSPAVNDQIKFQRQCIKHYSQFNNVQAFFITNEQSWGDWLDYSHWARQAWAKWLEKSSPKISFWNQRWGTHYTRFEQAELPASGKDGKRWEDWLRFRVDSFIEYHNRLYDGVISARTRFIPIAHKWIPYNAFDSYANRSGLKYSPCSIKSDLFAMDSYGQNGTMYAGALAFGKPAMLAETNLPGGRATTAEMVRYLLDQFFHGMQIETIYDWGNSSSADYHSHDDQGVPRAGTVGVSKVAKIIGTLSGQTPEVSAPAAVVVPENAFWPNAGNYRYYQHPLCKLTDALERFGIRPHILYSGDITPDNYIGTVLPAKGLSLSRYKLLFGVIDSGKDNAFYESPALQSWVRKGGVLFLESRNAPFPAWVRVQAQLLKGSKPSYSTIPNLAYWKAEKQAGEGDVQYALAASGPSIKPWALWDGQNSESMAAALSPIGKGWVICTGTTIYDSLDQPQQLGLLAKTLSLAAIEPMAEPPGPACLRLGNLIYLRADHDWNGLVRFPAGSRLLRMTQYSPEGDALPGPTMIAMEEGITGSLIQGQFIILELSSSSPTPKPSAPVKLKTKGH